MNIVERLLLHGCIGAKVATLVELLCWLRMLLVLRLIHHGRMRRMRSGTWVHWRHIVSGSTDAAVVEAIGAVAAGAGAAADVERAVL